MRLAALTAERANRFQLIRFVAATAVILFHCYALTDRWTDEPLWRLAPELNLSVFGVGAFFVVGGFLVTRSWLERAGLVPFVAARVLRIYPALLLATVLTILLAAWSSPLPLRAFATDPRTLDFAWRTTLASDFVATLPGAFATNPFRDAVNGSLWTLPVEVRLYAGIAIAIFSFPIQQILVARIGPPLSTSPPVLFAAAFPLTLALAALSWHGVERPTLALKSRFHGSAPRATT